MQKYILVANISSVRCTYLFSLIYSLKEEANLQETASVTSSKRVFLEEMNVSELVLSEAFCVSCLLDPCADLHFILTAAAAL